MQSFTLGLFLTSAFAIAGCATTAADAAGANEVAAAPVTLTSAPAEDVRFSRIARPVSTSDDEDLRRVASLKSRCEAANDDDACVLIARGRMR